MSLAQATLGEFNTPSDDSPTFDSDQRFTLQVRLRSTARRLYWGEYDRNSAVCHTCGRDAPLEIHHRDRDPFNNHLYNLMPVCRQCHRRTHMTEHTHRDLEQWKQDFREAICK